MLNKKRFLALGAISCIISTVAVAYDRDEDKLRDTQTLRLSLEQLSEFNIDVGAGSLIVIGDDSLDEIVVEAKIYQDKADNNYELSLDRTSSSRARLIADVDGNNGWLWSNQTWIDLDIRVPASLSLDIDDGSGPMEVEGIDGTVDIDDGSGQIQIRSVVGNVYIDDGSGSITASDLGGDIEIDDGSGSVRVHNAGGTVTVSDGSGSIDVDGAANFVLKDDGSGSVDIDNVSGDIDMG